VIRRIRRATVDHDAYGDPVDVAPDDVLDLVEAFVAPRESPEVVGDRGRQGVVLGLSLYGPVGLDVLRTDLVEVDGVTYEVEGEPGTWVHPRTGWAAGMTVALRRATG
jgi:hypothetical protein